MKAIGLIHNSPVENPECLLDLDIPSPAPGPRDLLVRVEAISVNPIDTKIRLARPPKKGVPTILGYDAAGTVESIGEEVKRFQVGDAVYYAGTLNRPGSNAQYQVVDERIVGHKPKSLVWAEAASIPLTVLTAWEGLFFQLGIDLEGKNIRQSLLLIGASGGVGSMVIQLAKIAGLRLIATTSSPESEEWCRNLGAEFTVNYLHPLPKQLEEIGCRNVDFIFNAAHTTIYWETMAKVIAPLGSICCLVDAKEPVDLNLLKSKAVRFAWEFMFTRASLESPKIDEQGAILDRVAKLLDAGKIRPVVQETLSPICARTLREAHARIESGKTKGKIVLTGWN
jgi:zinc-binding alcohol dehydrogenase family protein